MNSLSYNEYLINLLNDNIDKPNNELLLNTYITLLSLNNNHYSEDIYNKELEIIENFLRKVNNLKVKIQLKRKLTEIENLHNEIKELYKINKILIDNYNINNIKIIKLLDTKDPINLTTIIDNLTKEKIQRVNNKEYYHNLRNKIINLLPLNKYNIDKDTIYIDDITIPIKEFYYIFLYLLNIDNYPRKYNNNTFNNSYLELTNNLINIITKKEEPNNYTILPIALTYLLSTNINYSTIDMHNFTIDNIKITDLYSFANNKTDDINQAKWKNITIPNEYLLNKIKEITKTGMYYYIDDKFILESIKNNHSDFKININISNMKEFLIQNINNLINQS